MAIYDTDPNTTNRAEPTPQTPDQHNVRSADGTTAITNKLNSSTGPYVSTKDAKVKVNDGTIDVIKLGLQDDATYQLTFNDGTTSKAISLGKSSTFAGLLLNNGTNNLISIGKEASGVYSVKVAKSGYDANTAANENLVFNSSQNMFKIVSTGTASVPGFTVTGIAGQYVGDFRDVYVTHNLGYIPAVMAFVFDGTAGTYTPIGTPYMIRTGANSAYWGSTGIESTSTQLHIFSNLMTYGVTVSAGALTVRYYILQETAN